MTWMYNYIPPAKQWICSPIHTQNHYGDVIISTIASQITSLTIVYSTVYSDVVQRKHQSSVSLAFVRGIHRGPVNSPHKWPVTRKMFPFDDVIMLRQHLLKGSQKTIYVWLYWNLWACFPGCDSKQTIIHATSGCSSNLIERDYRFLQLPCWWENIELNPGDIYMRQWTLSSYAQVLVCLLLGVKPLLEPMLTHFCPMGTNFNGFFNIET